LSLRDGRGLIICHRKKENYYVTKCYTGHRTGTDNLERTWQKKMERLVEHLNRMEEIKINERTQIEFHCVRCAEDNI